MPMDVLQTATSAITTAVISSFSTTTTIVLMRYFPRILDKVESSVKQRRKSRKEQDESIDQGGRNKNN